MNVDKRGQNKYRLSISCGFKEDGKRNFIRKTVTAKNDKELKREKAKILMEYETGNFATNNNVKFKDFAYEWLDFIKFEISEETVNRYKLDIELRIIPKFGNYKLKDLNVYIIDKFKKDLDKEKKFSSSNKYKDRANKPKTDKHISDKSKNEVFKLLRRTLDKAVMWGNLGYDPAQKVETPKFKNKNIQFYDDEQTKTLFTYLENENIKWQTIIKIGIYTEMISGEIAGLSWKNIDLKNGLLHIEKQCKYSSSKGVYLKTPKSEKSIRTITIPKAVIEQIKAYKKWYNQNKKIIDIQNSGMLFYAENDGLLNPDNITDWFSKFIKKNELDKITVHGLRHTHATLLASNNMYIPTLSARLGHADTNITNQYYVHSISSRDNIASDKIEKILS
mgnify:CR=1 FL=1